MLKLLASAPLALLLLTSPVTAQPAARPAPTASDPAIEAHLAFVGEVGRLSTEQIDAMNRMVEAKSLLDSLTTPAGVVANGPKVRALLAQTRQDLSATAARLRAVKAPDTPFAPVKPATLLADLLDQNAKLTAYVQDTEALVLAAERGDSANHARLVPKVASGAFLLMDGMRLTYRNRQAAVRPDRSTYQALGVGMHLYGGMAAAGRAWYNARMAGQPAAAGAALKTALAGMAEDLRGLGRNGRSNVARELADIERLGRGVGGQEAETFARLRAAVAERGKLFDVGDEIAAWAERAEAATGAQLAASAQPALMEQLIPLEVRFQTIAATEAKLAAKAP